MTTPRQLPIDGVHVYVELLADFRAKVEHLQTWLSPREQAQVSEFRFERDRHRYIVGHSLLRGILAQYLNCEPLAVPIQVQSGGKPVLDPSSFRDLSKSNIGFNLSSCHSAVAIVVAPRDGVGVDIEDRVQRVNPVEIARANFAPIEVRWLQESQQSQLESRFLSLWTCKEAFTKAVGMGLALPFDQFSIEVRDRAKPQLAFVSDRYGQPGDWAFFSREITPGVQLAVSIRMSNCRFEMHKFQLRD